MKVKMPSAEETTYLIEVMPEPGLSQDSFTSRDVDVLVSRIKENLRLSGYKSRSSLSSQQHKMRASPYTLPSRCELYTDSEQAAAAAAGSTTTTTTTTTGCRSDCNCRKKLRKHRLTNPFDLDDSYERFQALLRNGALIKEAVKRLQTSPDENNEEDEDRATSTSATSTTLDSMDEEEDELYRRKQFYYDSEDEPPVFHQPLDL